MGGLKPQVGESQARRSPKACLRISPAAIVPDRAISAAVARVAGTERPNSQAGITWAYTLRLKLSFPLLAK